MLRYENDCVGCPQGCIHCGRQYDYPIWTCDKCGKETYDGDEIYVDYLKDGSHYCEDCCDELGIEHIITGTVELERRLIDEI